MGLRSSAYDIPLTIESTPGIGKILAKDIEFLASESELDSASVNEQVVLNGNSGLVRLWFAFNPVAATFQVTISKVGGAVFSAPLLLNGDNDFTINRDGYYRFDIGVRPGDLFNLKLDSSLSSDADVLELMLQQIQIGA